MAAASRRTLYGGAFGICAKGRAFNGLLYASNVLRGLYKVVVVGVINSLWNARLRGWSGIICSYEELSSNGGCFFYDSHK